MSSESKECACCNIFSSSAIEDPLVSVLESRVTQTNSAGNGSQAISPLLEQNNETRAEILALENLLCEKYADLMTLQANPEQCTDSPSLSNHYKLQRVANVIDDLERFSEKDGLNEDAIDEYIRYLEYMYTQVPIIGPDTVQTMCYSPLERTRQYFQSRNIADSEKMLFVVKDEDHYSLIVYNAADAAFYHYNVMREHNQLAQQLMFTLRQCFDVTQLVDVEENSLLYVDSGLFCIDKMTKILLSTEEERAAAAETIITTTPPQQQSQTPSQSEPQSAGTCCSSSPIHQFLQMHSHPDYLKIIIMSRYIVTKLSQIEKMCSASDRHSSYCSANP